MDSVLGDVRPAVALDDEKKLPKIVVKSDLLTLPANRNDRHLSQVLTSINITINCRIDVVDYWQARDVMSLEVG